MAITSRVELAELSSQFLPEAVPYAVLTPEIADTRPLPLCLLLMGGGGSRQTLVDCKPLFELWWSEGAVAPIVLATPSPGMSYYVEDAAAGVRWESFLLKDFILHLRKTSNIGGDRSATAIAGISMGGLGALKIALAHPEKFACVAAMNPMIEPGFHDEQIGARNRLHHSAGGPERLIGPHREPELFAAEHPANRAIRNAAAIRESDLAIYFEAGDNDFVNAHDGAEFLHRVLWELDISHEYRLLRGGDHGGSTFRPRMRDTFAWVSAVLSQKAGEPSPEELAIRAMRAQMEPAREQAAAADQATRRRFGRLPEIRIGQ